MQLFDFVNYSIWLSALVGIYFYPKFEPKSLKLWVAFVVGVIFVEIVLPQLILIDEKHYYQRLYTIIRPIEYSIIAYSYFDLSNSKELKIKLIKISVIIYFLYSFFQLVTSYDDKLLGNNTSMVSYTLFIILIVIYYQELLVSNEIIYLHKSPLFIYSIGIFIFCCGNVIVSGFYVKIAQHDREISRALYKFMNYGLLIIRSITLIIAFYVGNTNHKLKHE